MIRILPRWKLWPRWKKVAIGIYVAGAVVTVHWAIWTVYDNGGFSRPHTPMDFLIIGGIYLALILLWPLFWTYVFVAIALMWFGVMSQ